MSEYKKILIPVQKKENKSLYFNSITSSVTVNDELIEVESTGSSIIISTNGEQFVIELSEIVLAFLYQEEVTQ